MFVGEEEITFYINAPLKTVDRLELKFSVYKEVNLCIVRLIKTYMNMTEKIRNAQGGQLLISYVQPHGPVSRDTVRRWILETMKLAGIDTMKYKAHSTRAASTSAALRKQVPVQDIMKAASWRRESTFTRFYRKDVEEQNVQYSHRVLDLDEDSD